MNLANDPGEHMHAMHTRHIDVCTEAREILASSLEPEFPVEAEKARKGLHFMLPSSWAVDAIQMALRSAAQTGDEHG